MAPQGHGRALARWRRRGLASLRPGPAAEGGCGDPGEPSGGGVEAAPAEPRGGFSGAVRGLTTGEGRGELQGLKCWQYLKGAYKEEEEELLFTCW